MLWVIRATRNPMLMVFRAPRKLMLWYLEQHISHVMVFRARSKSMLKVIPATRKLMPQFQGQIFWKLWIKVKVPDKTLKKMLP